MDEKRLTKTKEEKKVRVVSWRDPILTHIRREMYSNYGEAWTNPIICGGMVGGYMEAWAMSGLLDIREVILEDNTSISDFLDALDEFATYQENFQSNIMVSIYGLATKEQICYERICRKPKPVFYLPLCTP